MAIQVGALPAEVDLILYAGDDFWLRVEVRDPSGDPIDLSTYTAKSQIRVNTSASDILAEFAIVVDGSALLLSLPPVVSAVLPSHAVWDVQIINAESMVTTLAAGKVTTMSEVTR